MAIAAALPGFNDLGRSVTPNFLCRNRFYSQLSTQYPKSNKKSMWEVKKNSRFLYKRINEYLPSYLNEHLILNNKRHSRNTRFSSINAVCPKYRRETEGGRSFAVSATRLWNSTPIEIRKLDSVACFKKNMFAKIFKEQQCLHHFII